jgi:hypothetical protein
MGSDNSFGSKCYITLDASTDYILQLTDANVRTNFRPETGYGRRCQDY